MHLSTERRSRCGPRFSEGVERLALWQSRAPARAGELASLYLPSFAKRLALSTRNAWILDEVRRVVVVRASLPLRPQICVLVAAQRVPRACLLDAAAPPFL